MKLAQRMVRKHGSAFTLVELLIVVTIVGILAVAAVAGMTAYSERAKKTSAYDGISKVKTTIDLHIADKGTVPADLAAIVAAGFAAHVDSFDGEFYDDYSWAGANLDANTKRFNGTITANPRAGSPTANINYNGATGQATKN